MHAFSIGTFGHPTGFLPCANSIGELLMCFHPGNSVWFWVWRTRYPKSNSLKLWGICNWTTGSLGLGFPPPSICVCVCFFFFKNHAPVISKKYFAGEKLWGWNWSESPPPPSDFFGAWIWASWRESGGDVSPSYVIFHLLSNMAETAGKVWKAAIVFGVLHLFLSLPLLVVHAKWQLRVHREISQCKRQEIMFCVKPESEESECSFLGQNIRSICPQSIEWEHEDWYRSTGDKYLCFVAHNVSCCSGLGTEETAEHRDGRGCAAKSSWSPNQGTAVESGSYQFLCWRQHLYNILCIESRLLSSFIVYPSCTPLHEVNYSGRIHTAVDHWSFGSKLRLDDGLQAVTIYQT